MDYAAIKDTVKLYTKDPLTNVIDQLMKLAEVQLVRDLPSRLLEKVHSFSGAAGTRRYALPTDFRRQLNMRLTTYQPPIDITYLLPQNLAPTGYAGQPRYYTVDNAGIAFDRTLDVDYTFDMVYMRNLDIVTTLTDPVADLYPDLYVNAVLIEVADFRRDKEFLGRWKERYSFSLQTAIDETSLEQRQNTMNTSMTVGRAGTRSDFMSGI